VGVVQIRERAVYYGGLAVQAELAGDFDNAFSYYRAPSPCTFTP